MADYIDRFDVGGKEYELRDSSVNAADRLYTIIDMDSATPDTLYDLITAGNKLAIVVDDILFPLVSYDLDNGSATFATVYHNYYGTTGVEYYNYDFTFAYWQHNIVTISNEKEISYGTNDLTVGTSYLTTGKLYVVYE